MALDYSSGIAQFNPYQATGPMVPIMTNSSFGMDTNNPAATGSIMDVINPGAAYTPGFPQIPGMAQQGGIFGGQGGGFNWNALGNIANLIGGFGSLYSAFQGAKVAKESLALQREAYQTNLANQRKSYNTALEDRARTRGVMEGSDPSAVDKYIRDNSL